MREFGGCTEQGLVSIDAPHLSDREERQEKFALGSACIIKGKHPVDQSEQKEDQGDAENKPTIESTLGIHA